MKKQQKLLIVLLTVVLIIVTVIIISVKTKEEPVSDTNETNPTMTLLDENGNTIFVENTTTNNFANSENAENYSTDSGINNSSPESSTNKMNNSSSSSSENIKPTSKKEYDLTDAELLQSQKISSGELKLYKTISDGEPIFLFVSEKNENKIYAEIPGSYSIDNIYYANVDMGFGDEIIIHANTYSGNSPIMYKNYVYKITSDGFKLLIDSDKILTGFTSSLKENHNIEISNSITGFKKTINIKSFDKSNYWNESGKLINKDKNAKFEKTYYTFEPFDYDDDGLFEIKCSQYVSLGSSENCIGFAMSILKYNIENNKFEIVKNDYYLPA